MELDERTENADGMSLEQARVVMAQLETELREPLVEALELIARTARRARASGRRARPIPQASFDATMTLIEAMARGALEQREPA